MRNLKKILALALALVMSMSLMATANAFTDDDSITDTYETAVTVLSGLKVFQGYDDGSFLPQGAITRAEVAAIIYRIVTGDVADTQVGIYADYNKFDDVASTSWYAGYVNFCANAEYIKGYDARTFGPNDPVTGYQALAMILRALGYDKNGEFTGTNWTIQTAAVGEQRGITKNITAGTLNVPATREVVAEILFRAILVNKVNYTPAFGYTEDDTSIGYDTFKLEEIEGVVVANEYADLYSGSPMKAGRTEMIVDGNSYVIDYTSTLEDIGENHAAYITGSTVLTIEKTGNTVFETGAESDIESDDDFEDVTGLERGDATEQFINFANDDVYEAQIRIVYSTTGDGDDRVSIRDGQDLTQAQYDAIRAIFTNDDYTNGWVLVGTTYRDDAQAVIDDVSNDMRFRDFVDEYLEGENNGTEVNTTDNGEWLKVIDNDGDGVADYVLLTEFAMSVIERISRDNEYTLADLANDDAVTFDDEIVIDGGDIVTEDELAADDVVIYTLIDGNYYMSLAEMVTETVDDDRNAINSKTETMTCDGTEYVQSHIGYGDGGIYYHDVTEAYEGDTYDLYLDYFGYVRLYVESDYNTFMLLTDGWYEDDNRTETFQAYYWDVEAGEETLIDVVDDDDNFISNDQRGDEETWGNLWGADVTYSLNNFVRPNTFASNIAGYSETDDGYDLKSVEDSAERMDYDVKQFMVDGLKDETLEAMDGTNDIQATTNTQYYLVIRSRDDRTASGWSVDDVITWTGYKNAPAEANLVDGAVGYAVTHDTRTAGRTYDVADVVVFETEAYNDRDVYFVYAPNNWRDFINNSGRAQNVWGIGYDYDDGETITSENRLPVEEDWAEIINHGVIQFYKVFDNETVEFIGDPIGAGEYAANDIYAGWAETSWDVEGVDYIRASVYGADDMYISVDAPVYTVTGNAVDGYDVAELNRDKVDVDDLLILFTDGDDNVEYAINVTESVDDEIQIPAVWSLWNAIRTDATTSESLTFYGVADDTANDSDPDAHKITVSYAQANANKGGLYAGGRDILSITSGGSAATIPATPVKSTADVVYTVVTEDKTGREEVWTLTLSAARADAVLYSLDLSVATIGANNEITMMDRDLSINEFIANFRVSAGAKVEWTFWNAQGIVDEDDYFQTMQNVQMFRAIVTPENGDPAYAVTYSNAAYNTAALGQAKTDAVKAVKDAIEAALEEAGVSNPAAAMTDATTTFIFNGNSQNLKGVIDAWTSGINGSSSIEDVDDARDYALGEVASLVDAYVKATEVSEPEAEGIEVLVDDNKIYTANDDDATATELGEAIEAALVAAGYTDVKYQIGTDGVVWDISAVKGAATVNFTLNPASSDVALLGDGDSIATAISSGAETVYLTSGTYDVTGLQVNGELTIIGNGDVTIEADGGNGDAAVKLITGTSKLVVKGVTFVNGGDNRDLAIQGNCEGSADAKYTFEISDCTFIGYGTAIQMMNSDGGSITNCTFDSYLVDISVSGVSGPVLISGNTYSTNNTDENIGVVKTDREYITIEDDTNIRWW